MNTVVTTMWSDDDRVWTARTTLVDPRQHPRLPGFLRAFWRASRGAEAAIVLGSVGFDVRYRDLIAIALLKLRRPSRRPAVIVSEATWEAGSAALAKRLVGQRLVARLVRRGLPLAIDGRHVTYCVLSTDELTTLPDTWRLPADRVTYTPFSTTMWGHLDDPTWDGGYVFAGGDSLRDYDLLLAAAAGLDVPLRIATHILPCQQSSELIVEPVSTEEFGALLCGARVVVVPLQRSVRSAGQQTYLNALALGKPVIVTDAPGVRDYIDDGVNGLVVAPEAAALREAIDWVLDPANAAAVADMTAAARATARGRFTPARYRAQLLQIADDAVARRASSP